MMTDTKTLPPDTDEQPPQPKTKRLDMSGTQLVGGAFAAMTAAVIGAQLGVAGTVLGAAIGSVVAGTAGSLYTASLKHTQTKIASAFIGRVGDTPVQITTTDRTPDDRSTVDGWHAVTQPAATVARPARTPHARFPPRTPRRSRPPSPRPHKAPSPAPNRRANQVRSQPPRQPSTAGGDQSAWPATTPATRPAADSLDPTAGKR